MATLKAATTMHRQTDKSVEILTNPHTYVTRSHDEDKKGWVEWEPKGTQLWQVRQTNAKKNVAGTQSKCPDNKAHKWSPPHMAATNCC